MVILTMRLRPRLGLSLKVVRFDAESNFLSNGAIFEGQRAKNGILTPNTVVLVPVLLVYLADIRSET